MRPAGADNRRHVTADELDRFGRGSLAAERVVGVSDHLRDCGQCAETAAEDADRVHAAAESIRTALREDADADHVTPELLAAYVNGALGEADFEVVDGHLAVCPMCAEDAADLRAVDGDAESTPLWARRTPPRKAIWAVAASVAAALILFVTWRANHETGPQATVASQPELPKTPDSFRNWQDDRFINTALNSGRLDIPTSLSAVAARTGVLLGPSAAASFGVVRPIATAVSPTRPLFEWQSHARASGYTVNVYDETFTAVASSGRIKATGWTPEKDLERGRRYQWQVIAHTPDGDVLAPTPPAAEARFVVLDQAHAIWADRIARRTDDLLVRAILEAHLGLLDLAERHLIDAQRSQPTNERWGKQITTFLEDVRRARAGDATERR